MTQIRCFKLNQYNWLGQKLLTQHRYDDILQLRQYLSRRGIQGGELSPMSQLSYDHTNEAPLSDHINYISGLSLMKISSRLDELIYTLQRLNIQKNGQYFLLLCQCLSYLGHHDSVVALCKQVLNREIDMLQSTGPELYDSGSSEDNSEACILNSVDQISNEKNKSLLAENNTHELNSHSQRHRRCEPSLYYRNISEDSLEFKKIFANIRHNHLINDSKLWFIFALSLEIQLQFRDADFAHRVACKLASGQVEQILPKKTTASGQSKDPLTSNTISLNENINLNNAMTPLICADSSIAVSPTGISNYYLPHINYGQFCIRYRNDHRTATQILSQAMQISPPVNYTLNTSLALTLCSRGNSNSTHFSKALEMLTSLEDHSTSLRNPSFIYNQLALECKQKLLFVNNMINVHNSCFSHLGKTSDGKRMDLSCALIKSHIVVNGIVQSSILNPDLYKCSLKESSNSRTKSSDNGLSQVDDIIEALKSCDALSWSSYALWNNLGVCYLIKRRYIASLSCLTKAHQLNPLDWRINYNLALAHLHVNLPVRALCSSLAAKSYHSNQRLAQSIVTRSQFEGTIDRTKPDEPIISTMIAISYAELGLYDEARRFYAELIARGRKDGEIKTPVIAIINYLLLLIRGDYQLDPSSSDSDVKSVYRLLDLLEQAWLQRSPFDSQFSSVILNMANQVGEYHQRTNQGLKKIFAWKKLNQ